MVVAAQHISPWAWVGVALLLLGAIVVLYWLARLLGFVIRAPFRALARASRRPSRQPSGLGADYEQLVTQTARTSAPGAAPVAAAARPAAPAVVQPAPAAAWAQPYRRSRIEAAALTFVIVMVSAGLMVGVLYAVQAVAGTWPSLLAFLASEVAILAFVTVRAYPPGAKRPLVLFAVLTLIFSAVVPLIYISWLWMTRKKWPTAIAQPAIEPT